MKLFTILFASLLSLSAMADQTVYGKLNVVSTTKSSHVCPSMTENQRNAVASPGIGDCVYNTSALSLNIYNGTTWKAAGGGVNQWLTSTAYQIDDVVIQSNKFYIALTAHTAGTFATDLAAAKWLLLNSSIKGKAQAGSVFTVEELQFPNELLTETASGKYLYEGGNSNLLVNPSFEATLANASWTASGASTAAEASIKIHGEKSLKLTASAGIISFYQDSVRHASQFADGVQGIASIRVKTSVAGIYVCPRQAGATILTNCASVTADNKWLLYKVPYVFGATSNGIAIVSGTMASNLVTVGAVTGDVYLDDSYVGTDAGIADVSIITPWTAYTPTFTGFGTVTVQSFYWRQVGGSIEIQGKFAAGTTTATEARISLPNSFTSSSSISTLQVVGSVIWSGTGSVSLYSLIEPSVTYLALGDQSASTAAYNKINGNVLTSASTLSLNASIPIANLSGSTQVFASQCGAGCADSFSAEISAAGVPVEDRGHDWINGNCALTTTNLYTCTFQTSAITVQPRCFVTGVKAAGTTVIGTIQSTSATQVLIRTNDDTGSQVANSFNLRCEKTGADYQASRTIIGSFKEVPKVVGVNNPKTCLASFGGAGATITNPVNCTTGTCVETFDSCGTFSPPAFSSTGFFINGTWAAGTWANSSYINCTCTAYQSTVGNNIDCSLGWDTGDQNVSTSATGGYVTNVATTSVTGTFLAGFAQIQCTGSAP